jgi:hypothetical protein
LHPERVAVIALKLLLAPSFVVGASLTARRFGPRVGGLVGGLPVVAGPILLVIAIVHGEDFGADASAASLVGLVSLTAFVATYAELCRAGVRWPVALVAGWAAFLGTTAVASAFELSPAVALALAFGAFGAALALVHPPGPATARPVAPPAWDLPVRAACAAAMVLVLTAASAGLGAHVSGLLAPFPIITSVLAAFTHAQRGAPDAIRLLRGMLVGFFAFALFSFTAAVAVRPLGVAGGFALATLVAALTQGLYLGGEAVGSRT